jgi:hypothetical protein
VTFLRTSELKNIGDNCRIMRHTKPCTIPYCWSVFTNFLICVLVALGFTARQKQGGLLCTAAIKVCYFGAIIHVNSGSCSQYTYLILLFTMYNFDILITMPSLYGNTVWYLDQGRLTFFLSRGKKRFFVRPEDKNSWH